MSVLLFSTPLFVFLFLPIVLLVYALTPGLRARNLWLLIASLVFYAWGEIGFLLILLLSVLINFAIGKAIDLSQSSARRKSLVAFGIASNVALLAFFKYFDFGVNLLNDALRSLGSTPLPAPNIILPLGISFFTFHALSYLIDIYRRKQPAASNPLDTAQYIFFFPQLIAGPILRWNAIAPQFAHREHNVEKFADGVRRFTQGLAKKILIANTVALPADQIFSLPSSQLSAADAWLGAVCYTLQIYFDFSGYSDMAVGLGKMFGFQFLENFNFPYISQSIREFWRRWHISLSTWFRDYLYFPLGGNLVSTARNLLNLLIVFFLCGLWHGASLTFVVWGLYHGLFIVLERTAFGSLVEKSPRLVRHAYAMLVVVIGWVLFRSNDFISAANHLYAMAGFNDAPQAQPVMRYATGPVLCAMLIGILFSTPWSEPFKLALARAVQTRPMIFAAGKTFALSADLILFFLTLTWMAGETYNPFIYFRF